MTITVNIHEAKTQLSRLLEQATRGQDIVIAKAGRPVARLVPVESPSAVRRLGFMVGCGVIDADLKQGFETDIEAMFGR